jgi:hypothetical protein
MSETKFHTHTKLQSYILSSVPNLHSEAYFSSAVFCKQIRSW